MRVAYFVDSSDAVNWGGQATSAGMRHLVATSYPHATFLPLKFGALPFRHATFLRALLEHAVLWAVRARHDAWLMRLLRWYGVDTRLLSQFDVVCFNGEGAIHQRSGHFFRLLGLLQAFKLAGVRVYALNQTVDVDTSGGRHAELLQRVYPGLDRVAVREPVSWRVLQRLGISSELVGDAAYALPRLSQAELAARAARFNLPQGFIGITATSAMKRNAASLAKMRRLMTELAATGRPLVFLANTKTDLYLAERLSHGRTLRVIDYTQADYLDAMAVIASATLVVGGRQHPNIFAAKYGVPFIGLAGNTHKMAGVVELLNYPVPALSWDHADGELTGWARRLLNREISLDAVTVPVIDRIDLGGAEAGR